ncbi:MAG: hypothetical protein E6K17_03610 [Methanobacteriota archaeon]|nr:MAG: hypothetical protein E6K17_03610 [Euryarchaeota archaeon]
MPSARQFRDTYHSWKKLFLQNWTLFRASRIGVVGLAIMIAFVLVALAAPYVGLRDPIYWLAPESDTISVQQFWSVNVAPGSPLQGINASVEHSVVAGVRHSSRQDLRSGGASVVCVSDGPRVPRMALPVRCR